MNETTKTTETINTTDNSNELFYPMFVALLSTLASSFSSNENTNLSFIEKELAYLHGKIDTLEKVIM